MMMSSTPQMATTNELSRLASHEQQHANVDSLPVDLSAESDGGGAFRDWTVGVGGVNSANSAAVSGGYIASHISPNDSNVNYWIDPDPAPNGVATSGGGQFVAELTFEELLSLRSEMLRNWSHSVNDPEFDLLRRPAWRGLMMALYITIILVGMIGNFIVVLVVVKNRNMQNVTNVFIANLALSDIWLCIFSLPIQLYYQLTDHWVFGETLCRVIFAAFAVPIYVSTLTILLIAVDRYWLIVYPLRDRMSMRTALILILLIIVISLLLSIPVIWFTSIHKLDQPDLHIFRHYCVEQWPSETARKSYSALMFLMQFCLPLCMTAILYYKIYCRLKQRPVQRQSSSTNNERKQKTNKILFAIVSLFVICWLPWNVYSLLTEIDHSIVQGPHFKFVDLLLKVFAMSSACVNPFLYCWLNDNFRKELDCMAFKMKLIPRKRGSGSRRSGSSPQYQIQPTADASNAIECSNMRHGVSMEMMTADMMSSRLSTTLSTSMCEAVVGANGTISPNKAQRNSVTAKQSGFGTHLTVPV